MDYGDGLPAWTAVPTRAAGLAHLANYLPRAGRLYGDTRNADRGPDRRPTSSVLSPYLRHRILTEREVAVAALAAHGPHAAEKFIQEVFWRTYWKGWLEGRPAVWTEYRRQAAQDPAADSAAYRAAIEGRTGIACFDEWAHSLVRDNWLHNHARMWFASIWIFTLRLPWALGAEFFLRHLLDGDPASNTLSWRWVAGLHTRGKHYVARASNIARYTQGRHDPAGQLDEDPAPLTEPLDPPPFRLPPPDAPPPPGATVALLLHEDDLEVDTLDLPGDLSGLRVAAVAGFCTRDRVAAGGCAPPVGAFAAAALDDALARAGQRFGVEPRRLAPESLRGCTDLPIVTPHAPVGPAADALAGLPGVTRLRRDWDAACWPHAGRGYFQLRTRIPGLLDQVSG